LISSTLVSYLDENLKIIKAEQEKCKGNEAFNSKSYDEAVVYYTRSIQLLENAAAFNNRALAYLKLEKWDKVIEDCDSVFKYEKDNVKGFFSFFHCLFLSYLSSLIFSVIEAFNCLF
jgi:tetratricopeptide (TPR) repeat protein